MATLPLDPGPAEPGRVLPLPVTGPSAGSRLLAVAAAAATVAAVVLLVRLTIFMAAPAQARYSTLPWSDWEVRHSCLSAYFIAAQAAGGPASVYDDTLYSFPSNAGEKRRPRALGPFNIDVFEYPPPFLLLPRALLRVAPDFVGFRLLWFAMEAAVVLVAMVFVGRALDPHARLRALMLAPLVWAALPMLNTLQKGNIQPVVIAVAVLAMVLFRRRQFAAGGALLAFATLSKLYPGLLVLYLLVRRDWRALIWTAAWSAVFVGLTVADTGWSIFASFLGHLPALLGGESFPALRNPNAVAINYSIPGIVFKLKLFGVPGMGFPASKLLGWLYTLIIVPVVVLVARRSLREGETPLVWLAILILATLRSPFLPQAYAPFPALWLVTLLAAVAVPTMRNALLALLAWAALNVYVPMDGGLDPRTLALVTTLPQVVTIAVAVIALRRRPAGSEAPAPA